MNGKVIQNPSGYDAFKTIIDAAARSKVSTGAVVFLFIVALIGFADASYLTVEHYRNVIPPCTTSGCETVLTSSYSTILHGFPTLWPAPSTISSSWSAA